MTALKRVLHALRLDKIAGVDNPCQEHASADIMKRAPDALSDGARLAKGLCDALRKVSLVISDDEQEEQAETFTEVLAEEKLNDEFWRGYYDGTSALQSSLCSIRDDDTVTDKPAMIAESLKQFADYIEQIMPGDVGKSLAAGIAASVGTPGTTVSKGAPMTDEMKKALGLDASATEADCLKALTETVEKAKKVPPPADNEPDGDDMAKMIKSGDAFRAPDGTIITKAKAGDLYGVLKSQNDTLAKQAEELTKARDREEETSFAKRATDLGFGEEFGPTLRKAYGGDATAQTEIEKRIKGLQNQAEAGGVFKNFGHSAPIEGTAQAELMAKVEEVKKAKPHLSDEQAYTEAYTAKANSAIVKRMKTEAQA